MRTSFPVHISFIRYSEDYATRIQWIEWLVKFDQMLETLTHLKTSTILASIRFVKSILAAVESF